MEDLAAVQQRRVLRQAGPDVRLRHRVLHVRLSVHPDGAELPVHRRDHLHRAGGDHPLPLRRVPAAVARRARLQGGPRPPVGAAGHLRPAQGRRLLDGPPRPGLLRQGLRPRRLLHRRQRRAAGQDHPRDHRADLRRAVLRRRRAPRRHAARRLLRPARALGHPDRRRLPGAGRAVPGQAQPAGQRGGLHPAQHRRDTGGVQRRQDRGGKLQRPGRPDQGPIQGRHLRLRRAPARPGAGLLDLRADPADQGLLQLRRPARRRPLPRQLGQADRPHRRRTRADQPARGPEQLDQPGPRLHPRLRLRRRAGQPGRLQRPARLRRQGHAGQRPAGHQHQPQGAARLLRRGPGLVLRIRDRGRQPQQPAGARLSGDGRHGPEEHDLHRHRRRARRLVRQQARLRRQVQRGEHRPLRRHQRQLQDPVRAQPARQGAEGRALPHPRRQPVPGDRRRAHPVDRRRLHDLQRLPVLAERKPRRHDARHLHGPSRDRPAAERQGQLHPQLGEGHRRRLRRHGQALRLGQQRPGAQDVEQRLPRHHPPGVGDEPRPAPARALPGRPVQGAALHPVALPHHQPGRLLQRPGLLERPGRPDTGRQEHQAAALLPDHHDAGRHARVLADHDVRAAAGPQPGGLHGGRLVGGRRLRPHAHPAHAVEHTHPRPRTGAELLPEPLRG